MRIALRSTPVWLLAALMAAAALLTGRVQAAPDEDSGWIADKRGCKVANPFPRPGESITWSGECKNGFAQGSGVLQWYSERPGGRPLRGYP